MNVMKQIFHYILLGFTLTALFAGCESKNLIPEANKDVVDLRYRVESEYHLDAKSAKPFEIVVKSSRPWTITSKHPDWCIIEKEEGEAVADTLVHQGKGESTTVKVQYYDNTDLDDRIDQIEIASDYLVGKTVTVYQKGIAYLNVPGTVVDKNDGLLKGDVFVDKPAGTCAINVESNQKWSAKILPFNNGETDWLSISDGETGELDGTVTVAVVENTGEKRYANVVIYDRHDAKMAVIKITQDGVQLDPEAFEIRLGYDQTAATLKVVSNSQWVAEKQGDDDWFSVDNPTGHTNDGSFSITALPNNDGVSLRKGAILLKTIPATPDDPVLEKRIVVKQAYPINPVRVVMNTEEIGKWSSDWDNAPVYNSGVGTLFTSKSRLHNGSMPFGSYTFRWKDWTDDVRIRHWFCYSSNAEMKIDIRPTKPYISFDFNAPDGLDAQKPSIIYSYDIDPNSPGIEVTVKFDPNGAEYCHVTYLCNGVEMCSFDTSENTMCTTKWGKEINMYIGADLESGKTSGSAVLEWYEYTPAINWGD